MQIHIITTTSRYRTVRSHVLPLYNTLSQSLTPAITNLLSFQESCMKRITQYVILLGLAFFTHRDSPTHPGCWSLLLSSIPWFGCSLVCLTIKSVEGHLGFPSVGLLMIRLLQTYMSRFLNEPEFSFLCDEHPRVQLLGHVVSAC